MIRKLLVLAAIAITASTFSTTSASALGVEVENPGAIEFFGTPMSVHTMSPGTPPIEVTAWRCANHWQGTIDANGHMDLSDIAIDPTTGGTGNCDPIDDCDGSGWEGQVEEGHAGTLWEYAAHLTICIEGQGGPLDGVPITIECLINDIELHCGGQHDGVRTDDRDEEESFVGLIEIVPGVFRAFFVEGEMNITNPPGFMHT